MTDTFARFIKRSDWIDYQCHKVRPEAFIIRDNVEKGISVVLLNNFPGDYWTVAQKYIGNPKKPVLGYGKLDREQIESCEIQLSIEERSSCSIPQHYELLPVLEQIEKIKIATQLAEKSQLVFVP